MNLKEIQDNAPDGAIYYKEIFDDSNYYFMEKGDKKYVWQPSCKDEIQHWKLLDNDHVFMFEGAKKLYPTPKEIEEIKKYSEYKETPYKCGATSSAKISVNSGKHTTADILNERQEQYGYYFDVARITQEIKESLTSGDSYHVLSDEQKLSLDMIANKMARAVNGNVRYVDNWADICGYSQLVVDSLKKEA